MGSETINWLTLEINVRVLKSMEEETNPNSGWQSTYRTSSICKASAFSVTDKIHLLAKKLAQSSLHIFWLKLEVAVCLFYKPFRKNISVQPLNYLLLGSTNLMKKSLEHKFKWQLKFNTGCKEEKGRQDFAYVCTKEKLFEWVGRNF